MASRIAVPRIPRPAISIDRDRISEAGRRATAWRPPRGQDLRLLLYRIAWAPLWISSDVPAPRFRTKEIPLPAGGPAGDHVVLMLGQIQRRVWLQRAMTVVLRALWLPLLIGCAWLALELLGGPEMRAWLLVWIGAGLLVPALVFAFLIRPTRRQIARMLDRSFGLQDRMMTAVDNIGKSVPAHGERAQVMYLQMADAANVATELRGHPAFRVRPPVRELVLAIACALMFAALFFMRGVGGDIPAASADAVPSYISAADRLAQQPEPEAQSSAATADAPTKEEVQAKAERSNQAQQDLKALSKALSDQAVTREAAEAIDRGDYAAAADLIRDVAENADQLSPAAREGLADDLDAAADQMSEGSEGLASAAHDAADGLREGGEAAKEGMNGLGDAVDQTASDIVSQQDLAGEMQQAEAAEAQRQASGESGQAGESGEQSGESSSAEQSAADGSQDTSGEESQGADAQPGAANGNEQGDGSGSSEAGDSESSAGDPQSASDQAGQSAEGEGAPGSADQPGAGSQPSASGNGGDDSTSSEDGAEGEGGQNGSGAGSGDSDPSGESGSGGENADGSTQADPNVAEPTETDAQAGDGSTAEEGADPRSAITLSRSPDAEGVQSSSNNGSASAGSGGGAAVSSGSSVQGDVGEAGPDSNRVPSEYRGIVEDYFSDDDR